MKRNKLLEEPRTAAEVDSTARPCGGMQRLAWLPVPLLLAAIIAARAAGLHETYENDALRLILSFTFYTLVSLGSLFFIGRSFLTLGSPGLLLLECGVVLWSLAGTVGDIVGASDANINVTIFNSAIMLAGLCILLSAVLSLRPQRALHAKPLWLGVSCVLALSALGLVTWASLAGWLPVFFIPGQGGTVVRYCVLISAAVMFVFSAVLLYAGQRAARTAFTYWYSLALLLLAVGLVGIMIQASLWDVVNWLSRTAQWLAGGYLLLAAVATLRESNLPLLPLDTEPRPVLYRDAMAVVTVLVATAVRLAFLQALGTRATFIMFYPAVILAALYGGQRAGLLATGLSAVLADYFWIEPAGHFGVEHPADGLSLLIFLLSGAMIAWITEAMHRARARASAAETQAVLAAARQGDMEALRASEEKFSTMFHTAPFAMSLATLPDAAQHDVNQAWLDMAGFTRKEDVIGKTTSELGLHEAESRERILSEFRQHGSVRNAEVTIRTRTGTRRVVLVNLDTVDIGGRKFMLATMQDITELKRVEEAVSRSQKTFFELVERAPFGIYIVDSQFRIAHMNAGSQTGAFRNVRPVIGRDFEEAMHILWPEAVASGIIAAFRHTLDTGEPYYSPPFINPRNDVSITESYEWELHQINLPDGHFGVICYYFDSTKLREAERGLRQSEEKFRGLFHWMGGAIQLCEVVFDDDGRPVDYIILDVNPAYEKQTGMSQEEVVGRRVKEIFPAVEQARLDQYGEVVRSGVTIHFEEYNASLGKWFEVYANPMSGNCFAAVSTDITERKRGEEILRETVTDLERSNKDLEQFAYISSHDLQEPLRQVRAFVQLLRDRHSDKFEGQAAEYFRFVYDGAARMTDLVRGLLDYSRAGGKERKCLPISCQSALDAALAALQGSIDESHALITHDDMPTIEAEPTQLTQVFQNLVGNAIKFRREGVMPAIHVGCRPDGVGWMFSVKDNGIGIDPAYYEKVFVLFQRLHGREKYAGTGIGLAICKKVVEQHGGNIWIESKSGEGSTFYFTLPERSA